MAPQSGLSSQRHWSAASVKAGRREAEWWWYLTYSHVPPQEIPGYREKGRGEEASREKASECLHVVYEGDEGQGGGRVYPEGKCSH